MGVFDLNTFLELSGKGVGPVGSLGTAFGMPSCLVNLTADVLALLPTSVLNSIRGSSSNGAKRADDVVKAAASKARFLGGHIEYDTEDGTFSFVSDSSEAGMDKDEGGALSNIVGFVGAAAGAAGRLYNNYNTTVAQINGIKECIGNYSDYLKYSGGAAGDERMRLAGISPERYRELVDQSYGIDKEEMQSALKFKQDVNKLIAAIDATISARLANPNLEPEFIEDLAPYLSGTDLRVASSIVVPQQQEVFRLAYGPPQSKQGKFLLSVDGIYFDSQTSGIIPALLEIENRLRNTESNQRWRLENDPNLGGRGRPTDIDSLKSYINTILDPNIIDDSTTLSDYYQRDNLLLDLIGQKNRRVYDVSAQIVELQSTNSSQILISNMRQVMLSETSHYLQKINKRKKQIELAVKMPVLYGKGSLYAPGEIPINDFSYLEGINFGLDIQKQRSLVLNQADVSGVVLPIQVKFTKQIETSEKIVLDHLLINNLGFGNIVSDASGNEAPNLSVNVGVEKEGLVALYNFLTFEVDSPSSTDYKLHNSSDLQSRLNAQIIGQDTATLFDKGVGITYLQGVTKHSKTNPTVPSAVGSYIKLPAQSELQDFLYNPQGGTFEVWTHVPQLDGEYYGFNDDYDVSGLYRLLLANENTGLQTNVSAQSNILTQTKDNGNNTVKGMIIGFTRDRRLTLNQQPSNSNSDNPIDNACLVIAPTQSFNASSVGFISKYEDCSPSSWYGMKYSIWDSVNGASLSACGYEFCQLTFTFDPPQNQIRMYCDGQLLTTSSYNQVFGVDPTREMINIPTLRKNNSFEYNTTFMSSVNVTDLKYGPKNDQYFTPWIVGGGFTDGMQTGNFMGGLYGGIISGLKGYIGSLKFYSKPLNPNQVLNNFNASKNFFKNIDVPNLMWEPILSE